MKSAPSEAPLNAQVQQRLAGSLVMMVDRHGIIHTVHGEWDHIGVARVQNLPSPESSSSCFDFFTTHCAPLFEGAADWSHALKQVLDHQSAGARIESCLPASKEGRWIEITILPLPVHGSAGALITCIDVTPCKQAEVALRNRETQREKVEERLHQGEATMAIAQRISHFGSWELDLVDMDDLGSNALRWSDEIFRIFGHEVGAIEASNENFFRAVHPDDRELISLAVNEAIRTHGRYSLDHRIILPHGEVRHIHEDAQIFSG